MNTCTIVRTNEKFFNLMEGSVVPKQFWPNAEEFCKYGAGYSILYEGKLASTAYSAFIHGNKLELGIETNEKFRGKGLANQCCSVLIDYCLDNGFEPVWACQKDNIGSFKLALKLGFEPIACQPYYGLFLERNSQLLKI